MDNKNQTFQLTDIPILIEEILSKLSSSELLNLCSTNKEYDRICQNDETFKILVGVKLGYDLKIPNNLTYKQFYLSLIDPYKESDEQLLKQIKRVLNELASDKMDKPIKAYKLTYYDSDINHKNYNNIFLAHSIEEALIKMDDRYNLLTDNQDNLRDARYNYCDEQGDEIMSLYDIIDYFISLLKRSDTNWIEEFNVY